MAYVNGALPTLLCSRPVACDEPTKRRRPTPAALEFPEESVLGPAPVVASPPGLRIKNTFIEGNALLSPSLETFYRERAVHTCPSKHAGRCLSLLEELAREMPDTPARTPLNIDTPCSIRTPLGDDWVQRQPCYELCESPSVYPGYAHHGLGGLLTGLHALAVQVPPGAGISSPEPASHRAGGEPRTVLSLAAMLEQEVAGVSASQQACPGQAGGCSETRAGVLASLPQYEAPVVAESTRVSNPPAGPALGSLELPSVGSVGHAAGRCKPCAFVHTKGCGNDLACQFCHLCGPEAKKARRQEKLQQRREATRARKERQTVRHCNSI